MQATSFNRDKNFMLFRQSPRLELRRKDGHTKNLKPFCDVLGWDFCKECRKEIQKDDSITRTTSQATNFMFEVSNDRLSAFDQRFEGFGSRAISKNHNEVVTPYRDCWEEDQNNDNVDLIVRKIFPVIYDSMSRKSQEISRGIVVNDFQSRKGSQSPCSRPESLLSTSISSVFSEEEDGFGTEHSRSPSSKNSGCIEELINLESENRQVKTPEKSIQGLARRSSVAGQHIRKINSEILQNNLEKWQPIFKGEYPRASRKLSKHVNVRAINLQNKNDIKKRTKEKLPNLNPGNSAKFYENRGVTMEPVKCKIKYIKNRWKDEALFNENPFAIQLDVS